MDSNGPKIVYIDGKGPYFVFEVTPQAGSLMPTNRWIGLCTMLVGLAALAAGILYVVLLVWRVFPLPAVAVGFAPWFTSFGVVWVYSHALLIPVFATRHLSSVGITVEQMGSVGKSGFGLAIAGVVSTFVGGFANLFDFGIVGVPLSIFGVSIPLLTIVGLLIASFGFFLLRHATASWIRSWSLLPASFLIFLATSAVCGVIVYVKGLFSVSSLIEQALSDVLKGVSWVVILTILVLAALSVVYGAALLDLGRLLSFGKEGPFKHRVIAYADGVLELGSRLNTQPEPPITIVVPGVPADDNND